MTAKKTAKPTKVTESTHKDKINKTDKADNVVTFDLDHMSQSYQKTAETNFIQAKENFEKIKTVSDDTTKAIEAALETAKIDVADLGVKAIDMVQTNLKNSMSHFEKLMGVKTMADIIELQSSYVREQTEIVSSQIKTLSDASTKLAQDVSAPVKAVAEKSMKAFK